MVNISDKKDNVLKHWVSIVLLLMLSALAARATSQMDIIGPVGSGSFGTTVNVLPNGNIVVSDPDFDIIDPKTIADVGAVYLYNGATGALISVLTGSTPADRVGSSGITVLNDGSFIVSSFSWDSGTIIDAGAVTWCSGTDGCAGMVSDKNSVTGSTAMDRVGNFGVVALQGSSFVINSPMWNGSRGAATWGDSSIRTSGQISSENSVVGSTPGDSIRHLKTLTKGSYLVGSSTWNGNRGSVRHCFSVDGCRGLITSSNSLVGTTTGDRVGQGGITELANGDYVVSSPRWNGTRGAVTWASGEDGITGEVSVANSLIGRVPDDFVGSTVVPLTTGNYVVSSPEWDGISIQEVGAATFCNGTTGTMGTVSETNSLVGTSDGDFSSNRILPLANGNYVVVNPDWDHTAINKPNAGAATWVDGNVGLVGPVTAANSLHGTNVNESVGIGNVGIPGAVALSNGNYVVITTGWSSSRGAVTLGNGSQGTTGPVSELNSLTGSQVNDRIGSSGVTGLINGNYVISSSSWNSARGAVTFVNGLTGSLEPISPANSLVGTDAGYNVGFDGVTALTNGNYVVRSKSWNGNRGAITWGSGSTGTSGVVSASNSLVGASPNNFVGQGGIVALPNGNYVVTSISWNGVGAVTCGIGSTGSIGTISEQNSLIGSTPGDKLGTTANNNDVAVMSDGNYVVRSSNWHNGPIAEAGAVTFGRANCGTTGLVHRVNSVIGTSPHVLPRLQFAYNVVRSQMVVGRPNDRIVTIFFLGTLFDHDGDGRADISVFRPSTGDWYLQQSSAGSFGVNFGSAEDKIAPADYDGDGKTDIAVYRPSTGIWYITNSSHGTVSYHGFGIAEDLPTPADYDGDGKADISVFRPSTGTWYRINSSDGSFTAAQFGADGDRPTIGDFDGDGKADIAVFRPSTGAWYQTYSSNGFLFGEQFGISTDRITPADYDGDGKTDIAIYRPSDGLWYVKNSATTTYVPYVFGLAEDIPVPGDFDGDGKADIAVWRPSDGTWYIVNSSNSSYTIYQFGQNGDTPTQSSFIN